MKNILLFVILAGCLSGCTDHVPSVSEMPQRQRPAPVLHDEAWQPPVIVAPIVVEPAAPVWEYDERTDEMTGKVSRFASLKSFNTVNLSSPYDGAQRGDLTVRNHASLGKDVMFMIGQGQLLCPSWDGCSILVRFDEGEAQRWRAAPAGDGSSTVLFLRNYDSFVRQLKVASVVRIRVELYRNGQQTFTFNVSGYDDSKVTVPVVAAPRRSGHVPNSCQENSDCQEGFICVGPFDAGRCERAHAAPAEIGDRCSMNGVCQVGLICCAEFGGPRCRVACQI